MVTGCPVSRNGNTGFPMEVLAAEITAVIRTCASLEVTRGSSEGLEAAFAVNSAGKRFGEACPLVCAFSPEVEPNSDPEGKTCDSLEVVRAFSEMSVNGCSVEMAAAGF